MSEQDSRTVLVSGAGGFLGSEVIRQLLNTADFNVIALTSNKQKVLSLYSQVDNFSCFSNDDWSKGKLPWENIDLVVHCAFARSNDGQMLAESLNFTNSLLTAARENSVSGFVNISSQSVYGQAKDPLWTEKTSVEIDSLYAMAKYATELLTYNLCNIRGTNLRLASLSGVGFDIRLTSRFVRKALEGEPLIITGGMQTLSYMDVRDAAEGVIALLSIKPDDWKGLYNLGSQWRYTIREIAETVAKVATRYKVKPVMIESEARDIDCLDSGMDSSLFYKDTKWKPKYNMEAMLESLFEYYHAKGQNK